MLTWQEIIKYREWALIELRIEAKRFVTSGIEVRPQNLTFTDIWLNCVDPEKIKMKNVKKREILKIEDIELRSEEKTILYELLATDKNKTLISFMEGENLEKDSIKFGVSFEVSALTLILTELVKRDDGKRASDYSMMNFRNLCKCPSCIKIRGNKLTAQSRLRLDSINNRETMKSMEVDQDKKFPFRLEKEKGFDQHIRDISKNGDISPKDKKIFEENENVIPIEFRPPIYIDETSNNCLNIVCFFEILELEGDLQFKLDNSIFSKNSITLGQLLIYDTSILCEMNNLEIQKLELEQKAAVKALNRPDDMLEENEDDKKNEKFDIFNLKPDQDRLRIGLKGLDELINSRILSFATFEATLR